MNKVTEKNEKKNTKEAIREARRKNAKLYPIYRMFSWDLLFFYSIEFLFYTITKGISASQVLMISGFYIFFTVICQLPAVAICDFLGKRKSIILGNFLLIIYMLALLFLPGAISIVIGNMFFALGYDIKLSSETNLLYDSVSTRGGDGLYSKLDTRGESMYYILDGLASMVAGYLFVINNYLPIIICLGFIIISTILSFGFKDIYQVEKIEKSKSKKTIVKDYAKDLMEAFKFIFNSGRMKSIVLFQVVFYSLITIINTYRSDLLVEINIPEEQFSMIFALLILIGGISLSLRKNIEKRFKNRTLTFISLVYIGACIFIGIVSMLNINHNMTVALILIMLAIQEIATSIWNVLEYKYLKNFTNERTRGKIGCAYEMIGGISASVISMLGGLLLNFVDIKGAFLIIGLASLACMVVTLDYMSKRFGLRPKEYRKEDIEFKV